MDGEFLALVVNVAATGREGPLSKIEEIGLSDHPTTSPAAGGFHKGEPFNLPASV
ncbi:MAG: hypothetical protein A4E50_01022 [Methanosaeta sp. PtaB.Bin087]|nr:MAG: hypothetical protein A4E50_01022 [Methanosaeta sp. PtaB.Bin087]